MHTPIRAYLFSQNLCSHQTNFALSCSRHFTEKSLMIPLFTVTRKHSEKTDYQFVFVGCQETTSDEF